MKIFNRAFFNLVLLTTALALTACWPNKEERQARAAEIQRRHCLDNQCDGDVVPKRNQQTETLFKRNGNWYIMPKGYGERGAIGFQWWEGRPYNHTMGMPPDMQKINSDGKADQITIYVFLTGRNGWPEPNAVEPWKRESAFETHWRELQTKGYRLERSKPSAELEVVKLYDPQGKLHNPTYYTAIAQKDSFTGRSPAMSCRNDAVEQKNNTCSGGEFWEPDIFADYRFNAKHANDWPAINQEITRIRSLIKKVQP